MTLIRQVRPAFTIFLSLSVLTGLVYPMAMTGIANLLMPHQATGSLIQQNGKVVGSALIGQNFTQPGYFHGRPSATAQTPYNAAASGASNMGPTSRALVERVTTSIAALKAENPEAIASGESIPMDLVTTSGSGLDPEISPSAAMFQVKRVARVRHLPEEKVRHLIEDSIQRPLMGWLGEPRVNVLKLNLALDDLETK